jgi:protease-4
VRRELELTRKAGKPVVVSMGDVAASGGYWISMAADEVIADEATITGSIGVIGLLPTGQGAMDKIGVHTAGYATSWLVDAYDPRRTLDPRFAELIQSSIDHVYLDFTNRVAAARKTTPQKIDSVAQGRVWSGRDALERGLVDRLGSYGDAITAAATRGKLGADCRVQYLEAEPGRLDRLLERFGARLATVTGHTADIQGALVALGIATPASRGVAQDLGWLAEVAEHARPFAAVTHCMCGVP